MGELRGLDGVAKNKAKYMDHLSNRMCDDGMFFALLIGPVERREDFTVPGQKFRLLFYALMSLVAAEIFAITLPAM